MPEDNYYNTKRFTDEVRRLTGSAAGDIREASIPYEFGGAGDCAPLSVSGVINYLGVSIPGFFGGADQLRELVVNGARDRLDLQQFVNNFLPIEVRGRGGDRVANSIDEYLEHIRRPGTYWDEPAWFLAAEVLQLHIVIHRVSTILA